MKYKIIMSVTALTLPLVSNAASNPDTFRFTENSAINMLNPDRGFYDAIYMLDEMEDYNNFMAAKENGYQLVYAQLKLEPYATTEILPKSLLSTLNENLNKAEEAGVKLILRFIYRSGDNPIDSNDPDKKIIEGHFAQLRPLLTEHKEIISIVQAGTIGAWGEWHSFSGDYADTSSGYIENRKEILTTLSNIFPDKYIQIRTPTHKELLFNTDSAYEHGDEGNEGNITSDMAFSDDIRAKIGHHNDCFLASDTDMGTYPSDNIEFWKNYVITDAKYAPVGGETCSDDEVSLTNCANAVAELKRMHYSYLNNVYNPDVLNRWVAEGCYDEIKENLGYRLVAKQLTINQNADTIELDLSIENKGYAAPYIKPKVTFILKNDYNTYTFEQNTDLRTFYPLETKQITTNLPLAGIESGKYCLALQIGENYSAIRLSNDDLWDEIGLSNTLTCNIEVNGTGGDIIPNKLSIELNGQAVATDILSYGGTNQDISGTAYTEDNGMAVSLSGNIWKKVDLGSYNVGPNTMLEFDFSSTAQGEIHGIGFDDDNWINGNRTFKLYGTQYWGISAAGRYSGSGQQHFIIPVGRYYSGSMRWLTFTNDHDKVEIPSAESRFSNIRVYEAVTN